MMLTCACLTPALGATASLPHGLGEISEHLANAIHSALVEHSILVLPEADLDANVSESFTRFVIGLSAPESARLLTYLFDRINKPDCHSRVAWQPGMVVIWDNRGTQHYAVADYLPHRRVMHRVAVVTDRRTPARPRLNA